MRIAFIHPDLGIGGAERLIVDAAIGLQKEGHKVTIYTSHCDKTHCFEEVADGTLKVKVYGDFLPQTIFGRFKIICASLRQLYLLLAMIILADISAQDFFIVDQLCYGLPLLHLFHEYHARILFYCHFPDLKLAQHNGLLRSIYRFPFDLYEQLSMSAADSVVVNSKFTRDIYNETFTFLKNDKVPEVIYPCVSLEKETITQETSKLADALIGDSEFFLSINRFEPKKQIDLAINSFKAFIDAEKSTPNVKLLITGGYDHQLPWNKEYLEELEKLADDLDLSKITVFNNEYSKYTDFSSYQVIFLPSISSNLKEALLSRTKLLLYTPAFEHFGIVPLEAMKFGTPVIAVNNGGPVETIISLDEDPKNGTGWLVERNPTLWASKLKKSLSLETDQISKNSIRQVETNFTTAAMTASFEKAMLYTLKKPYVRYGWERLIHLWKIPVFFIVKKYTETLFAYAMIVVLFFPAGIYQLLLFAGFTALYILQPEWFVKWW